MWPHEHLPHPRWTWSSAGFLFNIFWNKIYLHHFPLSSPQLLPCTPPHLRSLKFMASDFIFFHTHLLSPYNVTCMYDFRSDHLMYVGLFPRGDYFLQLSAFLNCIELCVESVPSDISLFHVNISVGVVLDQVWFRQPCCWDCMDLASLTFISRRQSLTADVQFLWLL